MESEMLAPDGAVVRGCPGSRHGCWKMNSGLLEQQYTFLAVEPISPAPTSILNFCSGWTCTLVHTCNCSTQEPETED